MHRTYWLFGLLLACASVDEPIDDEFESPSGADQVSLTASRRYLGELRSGVPLRFSISAEQSIGAVSFPFAGISDALIEVKTDPPALARSTRLSVVSADEAGAQRHRLDEGLYLGRVTSERRPGPDGAIRTYLRSFERNLMDRSILLIDTGTRRPVSITITVHVAPEALAFTWRMMLQACDANEACLRGRAADPSLSSPSLACLQNLSRERVLIESSESIPAENVQGGLCSSHFRSWQACLRRNACADPRECRGSELAWRACGS